MSEPTAESTYYGWLPGLTLGEFLDRHSEVVARLPYVAVTSVDSETAVSKMPWVRRHLVDDASWALATEPLVISGKRLLAAAEAHNLFTGFEDRKSTRLNSSHRL